MEDQEIVLTSTDKVNLVSAAKWGRFLAILGFVFSGFIILGGVALVGGSLDEVYPGFGGSIGFMYLLFSLLYVLPSYYLFQFSSQIKKGILQKDQEACSTAYNNLRRLFVFMGVFTIIVLAFYLLAMLFVAAGGLMGSML